MTPVIYRTLKMRLLLPKTLFLKSHGWYQNGLKKFEKLSAPKSPFPANCFTIDVGSHKHSISNYKIFAINENANL